MKKIYTIAAAMCMCLATNAQTEVMIIELTDGSTQTINVESIKEITFDTQDDEPTMAGAYTGTNTLLVGGMYPYSTQLTAVIAENEDGTLDFTWPEYSLENTLMGNLTLGSYTISNIPYDESKGAYYLDYSAEGLQQHFKAENNGSTTFDNDYVLGTGSTILIEKTESGIKVTNPFKLGAMPLSISATFEGDR